MRYRELTRLLGLLVGLLGLSMVLPLLWALYLNDGQALSFLLSAAICMLFGGGAFLIARRGARPTGRREALAAVGLGWLLCGAFGALPYMLGGTLAAFHDAFFETLSGLTTTGATVLTDIESTAASVLFWRSLTHWLGGMGVVVLFVAVLPSLGASGKYLFQSEATGPTPGGLRPRVRETASLLWKIYLTMTVLEIGLLVAFGMDFYDSLVHTFGTVATGGFSSRNASIAAYDSLAIELTIIAFMILAGTNFALYYRCLRGNRGAIWRDAEWRAYIAIMLGATIFVSGHLWLTGTVTEIGQAAREASFQVVSLTTTTGYCTADFDQWPVATKTLLVLLMFVGGSAGSTGGGMKVIRVVLLVKIIRHTIRLAYAPATVRTVRLGRAVVENRVRMATMVYFVALMTVLATATFLVALTGPDLVTSLTGVIATLNNIGPGLGGVGAEENYASFAPFAKYVLSICMTLGRLELFAILVLFAPGLWRR